MSHLGLIIFFSLLETFMNKSRLESGECYKRPFKLLCRFTHPIPQNSLRFYFLCPFLFSPVRKHILLEIFMTPQLSLSLSIMSDPFHLIPCQFGLPYLVVCQFWLSVSRALMFFIELAGGVRVHCFSVDPPH